MGAGEKSSWKAGKILSGTSRGLSGMFFVLGLRLRVSSCLGSYITSTNGFIQRDVHFLLLFNLFNLDI